MKSLRVKVTAIVLILAMSMTFMPAYAASVFNDVPDNHWAQSPIPYISDMAKRQFLLGYPDGTFKPDQSVTKSQALLIASRIMGYNNPENAGLVEFALGKYETALKDYTFQYKAEVSYLMFWGVLTPTTVGNYISTNNVDAPLLRHEAAVLLTHMLGKNAVSTATASATAAGIYADNETIPAQSRPFVNYATQVGLMKGMGENKFSPNTPLTRAQLSTIMYRVDETMDLQFVEGTIEDSEDTIENNISVQKITIRTPTGETLSRRFNDYTTIMLDGDVVRVTAYKKGQTVRLYQQNYGSGAEATVRTRFVTGLSSSIPVENKDELITGFVVSTKVNTDGTYALTFMPDGSYTEKAYTITNATVIYNELGINVGVASVVANAYARLAATNGVVTALNLEDKTKRIYGYLESVEQTLTLGASATKVTLSYIDAAGKKQTAPFTLSANALLLLNNKMVTYTALKEGMYCALVMVGEQVKVLSALEAFYIDGVVAAIASELVNGKATPFLTINTADMRSARYEIASDCKVARSDGKTLYTDFAVGESIRADINKGMVVALTHSNDVYALFASYELGTTVNPAAIVVNVTQNGVNKSYELGSSVQLYRGGVRCLIDAFAKGDEVVIKLTDGKISRMETRVAETLTGTLQNIKLGTIDSPTTVYLDVLVKDTQTLRTLSVGTGCKIERAGKAATVNDLIVGDVVSLRLSGDVINALTVTDVANRVTEGTVKEVTFGQSVKFTIADKDGKTSTYMADNSAKCTTDSRTGTVNDILVGYSVRVVLSGDTVKEVYITTPKLTSPVTGKVLSTDATAGTIRITQDNTNLVVTVVVPMSVYTNFVDGTGSGVTYSINSVTNGMKLIVVGNGTINAFTATTITVVP